MDTLCNMIPLSGSCIVQEIGGGFTAVVPVGLWPVMAGGVPSAKLTFKVNVQVLRIL